MSTTIAVATEVGKRETACFGMRDGLAVTTPLPYDRKRCGRYVITHMASGLKFGGFASRPAALKALAAVATLADWTQTREALNLASLVEPVRAAIEAAGGRWV